METALVKINEARKALAEARDLHSILEIRDRAAAMHTYTIAKGAGEAANVAKEIQLRAERQAGEFLQGMEKASGRRTDLVSSRNRVNEVPTLADLGIKKNQSHRWQTAAELPEADFEQYVAETMQGNGELTSAAILRRAKEHKRKQQREVPNEAYVLDEANWPENITLITGDFAVITPTLEPESISLIVTDPPYPREYLHLYGLLAEQSARLLIPGGSLLAMAGQSYLPEVLAQMTPHLSYHWTFAYLTPGGQSPQIWPRKVNAFWKPVLWFVKGKYTGNWQGDVIKSDTNDKRFHDWGQSESGIGRLIDKFPSQGVVLDPFVGGGTAGVVCFRLHRKFIGVDIDAQAIETTRMRIQKEVANASG